jgi:hypothetical protein
MGIRGRPRKRWIEGIEEDLQIIGIRRWRNNVKKEKNGKKSVRRLKPTVGCNASRRSSIVKTSSYMAVEVIGERCINSTDAHVKEM